MTTPAAAPLTTTSATQVPAGKSVDLVLSNQDPFALWALWISISAATDKAYAKGVQTWGASIIDNNSGNTLLRCQLHVPGPEYSQSETNGLWLGGLVLADHNQPFELSFKTDPGFPAMYTRGNCGVYYSVI